MNDGVDLSISQFRDAWQLLCSACPGSRMSSVDGAEYIFSKLPIAFFNVAVITERDVSRAALERHARLACDWAADTNVPWLFVVTHEALAPGIDAAQVLDGCGLAAVIPLTGMRAERIAPALRIPDGLEITVPRESAGCASIFDVNAAAYGVDLEACKPTFAKPSFWADHVPVLGHAGGKPAASAAVLMVSGHRYVALVATDPAQQRHGYAEALMRHALDVAARTQGEYPTALHATDAGRPLYSRMGYKTIATHTAFLEKRFLLGG